MHGWWLATLIIVPLFKSPEADVGGWGKGKMGPVGGEGSIGWMVFIAAWTTV